MEKAKRHPANPRISGCWRPVIQIILGLAFILLACTVAWAIIVVIPVYEKVSSVQDWDVPSETEIVDFDFDTQRLNPFRWCDVGDCVGISRLYVASDLSASDLETFYRNYPTDYYLADIQVRKSDTLNRDGRPIYVVVVRWVF